MFYKASFVHFNNNDNDEGVGQIAYFIRKRLIMLRKKKLLMFRKLIFLLIYFLSTFVRQLLLWPFQRFSNSRGNQFLKKSFSMDEVENDQPFLGFDSFADSGNATFLGVGPRENVKFEWSVTPWTECSPSCGPVVGIRVSRLKQNKYR